MKKGPKSHAEQIRQPLLDLWRGDPMFGRSVGCIATTFTFDAAFFEEHCLARFIGMECSPGESARSYFIEREEKLSQNFACVLVDFSQVSVDRSLRWHQLPVTLKGGGVQHAKLSLLVWEQHIRVLIGSANLTEPAYRNNVEQVAVLDFGTNGDLDGRLLKECVRFLRELARFAPGAEAMGGPQSQLGAFLAHVEQRADGLQTQLSSEAECFLVPLMRDGDLGSVLDQIGKRWHGSAPNESWVVSPFYDEGKDAAHTAQRFAALLTTRGDREIEFTGIGRTATDGTIQVEMPGELRAPSHSSLTHNFSFIAENVQENGANVRRPLHAKGLWLQREPRFLYLIGSSNFTRAGLGLHDRHNVELNVGYFVNDNQSTFGKLCQAAWPMGQPIVDPAQANFLGSLISSQDAADNLPRLHPAFGAALLRVSGEVRTIELEISASAPTTFEILDRDGDQLVTFRTWADAARPPRLRAPWTKAKLPTALRARWQQDGDWIEAVWIVNVFDTSMLPTAEELADLTLDELMAVLTSALPLHRVVMRTIEARRAVAATDNTVETDPHRRVSTSHHLLKRMRRASDAFEGIRRRLSEPVHSAESLRWRLHGPLGPIAFARKLAGAEGSAAGFMIAELATTIRQVEWNRAGSLTPQQLGAELSQVSAGLKQLAESIPAQHNLANYIRESFREAPQ